MKILLVLARILRFSGSAAGFGAALLIAYGVFTHPQAPIRPVDGEFLDKQGTQFTAEQYDNFVLWEKSLFLTFFSAVGMLISGELLDKIPKRRK